VFTAPLATVASGRDMTEPARNVPLTAEDGPITFRSKAHLIASVLGGLWDYPHKTEGVPVDLVRSWVDAVFDDHRRPHTPAPAGEGPMTSPMRMVAVEPTDEMLKAGSAALRDFYSEDGPYPRTKAMWRAMLASAPPQATGEVRARLARIIDPAAFMFATDELVKGDQSQYVAYEKADAILSAIGAGHGGEGES